MPGGEEELPPLTFLEKIGQGNFSTIQRVQCENQIIVLKKIYKNDTDYEKKREVLLKEFDFLKLTVGYPNIIQLAKPSERYPSSWYNTSESVGIFLECAPLGDLESFVRQHKDDIVRKGTEHFACRVMKELIEALSSIHEMGYAHRDVKPANVLVFQRDGNVSTKLGDLGFAKEVAGMTRENSAFDPSVVHSAVQTLIDEKVAVQPEQYCQDDMFAAGLLLYFLLSGGEYAVAPGSRPQDTDLLSLSHNLRCAGISEGAIAVMKCLTSKFLEEIPSAEDILRDPWFTRELS